jgi:hypothetical protein
VHVQACVHVAPLETVQAGGRKAREPEQRVELREGASADERERARERVGRFLQEFQRCGIDLDFVRRRAEFDQGAVDVEEERAP